MAAEAGRLPVEPSPKVLSVASYTAIERLAIVGSMEMSAEIDRMGDRPAVCAAPVVRVALRAGGLSVEASLKAIAVARRAVEERLAVAARVHRSSEVRHVRRPERNPGSAMPRSHGCRHVPAAQGAEGDYDRNQDAEKAFLFNYHF